MRFVIVQNFLLAILGLAVLGGWRQGTSSGVPAALGVALCAAAGVLAVLALVALGDSLHISPAPRPGARFVDRGVYRQLRHPMYTSVVVLAVGLFLLIPTLPVAAASTALIVFYLIKSRHEEKLLLDHYPEYREYRARTRGVLLTRGRI